MASKPISRPYPDPAHAAEGEPGLTRLYELTQTMPATSSDAARARRKGANIVFPDREPGRRARRIGLSISTNQGQACIAGSRLIPSRIDGRRRVTEEVHRPGPVEPCWATRSIPRPRWAPAHLAVHRGPGCSSTARSRGTQGGEVLTGGRPRATRPSPPVLRAARPWCGRARRPRVAHGRCSARFVHAHPLPLRGGAIQLANATEYGLGGGLWTRDLGRAHRVPGRSRPGIGLVKLRTSGEPGLALRRTCAGRDTPRDGFEPWTSTPTPNGVGQTTRLQIPPWYRRSESAPLGAPSLVDSSQLGAGAGVAADEGRAVHVRDASVAWWCRSGHPRRVQAELERLAGAGARAGDCGRRGARAVLGARRARAGLFAEARTHVPVEIVARARAEAERVSADCTVSLGGGSTVGSARRSRSTPVCPARGGDDLRRLGDDIHLGHHEAGREAEPGRDPRVLPPSRSTIRFSPSTCPRGSPPPAP